MGHVLFSVVELFHPDTHHQRRRASFAAMAGLIAKAEDAQDLAAAFNKFLGHVPNAATEITGLISELYAISSGARELHTASQDPRYLNRQELIEEDKRLVLQSIEQTFADIQREFGNIDRSIYQTPREAYRGVWKDIIEHFREESEDHLIRRLENYRLFLLELALIVHGYGLYVVAGSHFSIS